ncbi:GATA transcription factor 21-like [Hibiscus syriacus]|uniref:GATA transcription factor 21-like n=1 Tax=Hibiscus syriacus TaxID=106335 RepID=UPI001921CE33|nr:GATA transcription factor 21-like [Hibiscus syriacus]
MDVFQDDETNCFSNTNNAIRVCSDCNTTTTPLWRSGPRGPKSLCNACGIRQRKARRALEAAANGAAVVTDAASLKIKVHSNKEMKKQRTVYKKQLKNKSGKRQKKLCVKEFGLSLNNNSGLRRVFPQDVEDAAILLMELSCGLSHS